MKVKVIILFLISFIILSLAADEQWEGTVAMAQYGEFPSSGFYGASNSFPRNTIVEVKNLTNGKTVTLIIISRLDQEGVFLLVSSEAAQGLGFIASQIIRASVRVVSSADQLYSLNQKDMAENPDPDINPAASASNVEDSAYLRAIRNLRERYALSGAAEEEIQATPVEPDHTDTIVADTQQTEQTEQTGQGDGQTETDQTAENTETVQTVAQEDSTPDVPSLSESGARKPPRESVLDVNPDDPAILDEDIPEINSGFVKAEKGIDNLAATPDLPSYEKTNESETAVAVETTPAADEGPDEAQYNDFLAYPLGENEDYGDLALAPPSLADDSGLVYSDVFAKPGQYTYLPDNMALDNPEVPLSASSELAVDDSYADPDEMDYPYGSLVMNTPTEPDSASSEYSVDDTQADPMLHANRNFNNLAVASPLTDDEDKAVYDSLFAMAPEESASFSEGSIPLDPYALASAENLAGVPLSDRDNLLAMHDPEIQEAEIPESSAILAAEPEASEEEPLLVDAEPEAPEGDSLTYDTMLANPAEETEETDFVAESDPVVPGEEQEEDDQTTLIASAVTDSSESDSTAVQETSASGVTLVPTNMVRGSYVAAEDSKSDTKIESSDIDNTLTAGNDYLQLAVYTDQTSVMEIYNELVDQYPVTVVVANVKNTKNYKILIGPLQPDESGALLYNFRKRGFKDAFIKKG